MNTMYQAQQQQQSPSKLPGVCFRCNQPGHWIKDCLVNPNFRSPISPSISATPSDPEFPSIQCRCGAGFCNIRISCSHENPNRKYYNCHGKFENSCKYFKWCDQLIREEIREIQPITYPTCECQAGKCSLKVEEHGVNAGRRYFACPIKRGDGACNFRQWLDNPPESASVISAGTSAEQTSMFDDIELGHEAEMQVDALEMIDHENPAQDFQANMEDEDNKSPEGVCRSPVESPESHSLPENKMLENSESEMTIPNSNALEHPTGDSRVEDEKACVTTVVAILNDPVSKDPSMDALKYLMSYLLKQPGCHNPPAVKISEVSPSLNCSSPNLNPVTILEDNVPVNSCVSNPQITLKVGLYEGSIMTGNILQAFDKLALHLQDDLTTLLESMGPQNYESMRKEADCTFAALGRLEVNYGLFQLRVSEYINRAASLAHIEQLINSDSSSQELLSCFYNEQSRFEEISRAQCDAKAAFMASNNKLNLLREKASSLEDDLSEIEIELSCCEVENAGHRDNLQQITKAMADCKERLQAASQDATEAFRKSGKREIELCAAKAAFQRARAQLQN